MKKTVLVKTTGIGLMACGVILAHPFSAAAQESPPVQQEKPAGKMGMSGMMEQGQMPAGMPDMEKMREQLQGIHKQMEQELQQKLTDLREHAKTMEGIKDEKQLLAEMKKHQQMTDDLLGTMLEQRDKMRAQMKVRQEQMQGQMGKTPQTEK